MEPRRVDALTVAHRSLHIDDLPVEVLHHILNGVGLRDRSFLDPCWRFAAASVCRRWKAVVRDPMVDRSRALAASTDGPRRSLDSVLEKEDAFLVEHSCRTGSKPASYEARSAVTGVDACCSDRRSLKRAAVEGRLVSAAYLVDNVRNGSLAPGADASVFDPVPWSGVAVPDSDAALCRLLALDGRAAPSVAIAAIDDVLRLLAHRDKSRAARALLSRLVRYGHAALIDALVDHVPSAFSPWWHIRLACKHDRPAGLAALLWRALVSETKPKKWITLAWRKVALYDSIAVFGTMLDDTCPSWATPSLKVAWPALRASCAESWIVDESWWLKAARNGSLRVLGACVARGWPIRFDRVINEASLNAWWRTVEWAVHQASLQKAIVPHGGKEAEQMTDIDVGVICEGALRVLMRATNVWPRNPNAESQRNTVAVLCDHLERCLGRDQWPHAAAAIWRDSPGAASDDVMPWSRPFVFARWCSLLPATPDEIRSIVKSVIAVNDYGVLDALVAAIAPTTHYTRTMRDENGGDAVWTLRDANSVDGVGGAHAPRGEAIDLWRETVERYVQATRSMRRHRHRYDTRHEDMDVLIVSWNQNDAAEMLMFLASVVGVPRDTATHASRCNLAPHTSDCGVHDRANARGGNAPHDRDCRMRRAYTDERDSDDDKERNTNNCTPGLHATTAQWRRVCRVVPLTSDQLGWAPASSIASHLGSWLDERGLLVDAPTPT